MKHLANLHHGASGIALGRLRSAVTACLSLALILAVAGAARAGSFDLETKLTASDAAPADRFGVSVGISGGTAIVGAIWDDDAGELSGSAYLFDADPLSPTFGDELFKLTASDAAALDFFGGSVGISGGVAIVGATGDDDAGDRSGSAYLFDVATGKELFKLTTSDAAAFDRFGISVGVSGGVAIVGADKDDDAGDRSGSAYLFDADPLSATFGDEIFKLTASDGAAEDNFGRSVGISSGVAIVGAILDDDAGSASGSAYLFDADPLSPTFGDELFKLTASDAAASDLFGASAGISGGTAIVGAFSNDDAGSQSGSAYLFDADPQSGTFGDQLAKLTASDAAASDAFGGSVGISGGTAIVGADRNEVAGRTRGSAYLFTTPEPSSFLLAVLALVGVLAYGYRRCKV